MDQQAKRAIKSFVLTLRRTLEDEIAIQLKRYGFASGRWLPQGRLPHIEGDDRAAIEHRHLKAALEQHLRRIGADPEEATDAQRAEAVDWFVREVAFTHLNRLVALKCLEARGLIPEIITTRDAYGGRSRAHYDYRNAHPEEARQPDDALPAAIRHACRQVYAEFKFLFDVGEPATNRDAPVLSILWPSYPALKECIALINGLDGTAGTADLRGPGDLGGLWAEDEIIGWIYQFYNAEEKVAIRKRGRPRRPAEVAVINQFFTPRWIVKFLVDNTLGRLWLEMHPDSERVRAKCDYLVPEPLPSPSEGEGTGERASFPLDPDSPINNPHAPPRRAPKRPQDVRLIDPACGTMHFGHYAFEVFQEIYRDANEHGWHNLPSPSQGEGPGMGVPEDEIPTAILQHNLYGVDIDLRAVQLAGLSLFMKAKTANPDAHISHVNLVVADAVLPEDGARDRFLDQYKDDKVVQDAVRQVLNEMANVAEVGSLLRVEERLRDLLAQAGHAAVRGLDARRQAELPGFEPPQRQLSLAEAAGAQPAEWGARYTVARLLSDLRAFAAEALQTHDLNAQLFAQEAEKTVHLLDVFLNDYDVVVMNPPYGGTTASAKRYLKQVYPRTSNDIYASFFERSLDLLGGTGYGGALTSRTFLFLSRFQKLREEVLLDAARPVVVLDLGFGILDDAMVETCASVFSGERASGALCRFYRIHQFADREQVFSRELQGDQARHICYQVPLSEFKYLPRSPFAYWTSSSLRQTFAKYPLFDPAFGIVRQGKATGDDQRFTRQWWEVPANALGNRWVPFAKGGDYSRYYFDVDLVIDWSPEAQELHAIMGNGLPNRQHYFRKGLTYPRVTVKGFNVRLLRSGYIFADKGPSIFAGNDQDTALWCALAYLNSSLAQALLLVLTPSRSFEVGHVSKLPYAEPAAVEAQQLNRLARIAHDLKAAWDTSNETCTRFDAPWLVQAHRGTLLAGTTADGRPLMAILDLPPLEPPAPNLHALLDYVRAVEESADARLQDLQAEIDEAVYDLYEISPEDRTLIERELGERPPELVWPQMEGKSDEEKRREHVRRLISHFLLQALKAKPDGILPLTGGAGQGTALDAVRRGLEREFGEEAAFEMETDIKGVLGKDIARWLEGDFFGWHVKLYKRRPILWHLASPRRHFACFLYLHNLDRDTLVKVQTLYLQPYRRAVEAQLEAAQRAKAAGAPGAARRIDRAEAVLDDLDEFEKRLLSVIRAEVECEIPDWAEGPYRGGVYDPVLDDGVKVNILPLQGAGLLRQKKVV